ncbi:MAG TPA: PAS domain S-box protein [Bacteroidia bacterium]|jgi:hypothetical protein
MDKISLDFELAKTKHLLFKSKLRSILYGVEVDEVPVLSHFECTVGKWIYDHALHAYGHHKEVHELERVHEKIHTSARRLVELYRKGNVEEARSGLGEMESVADSLVALLTALETKLKEEGAGSKAVRDFQPMEVTMKELHDLANANVELDKIIKQQSRELFLERQMLTDFFMQTPAALALLTGPELIFELANPTYLKLVGYRDVIGQPARKVLPELIEQGFFTIVEQVLTTGEPFFGKEVPVKLLNEDGNETTLYLNFSYQPITKGPGAEGLIVFAYDVTDQVASRKLIEEQEKKYRDLANAMPDVVWTADSKGNVDFFNKTWEEFTGYSLNETKDWGWEKVLHPDDLQKCVTAWTNSFQNGTEYEIEYRWKNVNGTYKWFLGRAIPIKNASGEIVKWVGTGTEIDSQKELELKLRYANEDLEAKVKFRNLELEKENFELKKQISELLKK